MNPTLARERLFHVYYRSNDRKTIFREDDNYRFFLQKMKKQLRTAARLLGYCIMPNHFHLMLVPIHDLRDKIVLNGDYFKFMPTEELSEANRRWLMGFTKSYHRYFGGSGSLWRPHGWSKHHRGSLIPGLNYVHQNPEKANLVQSAGEWEFSSHNEYALEFPPEECYCDIELTKAILALEGKTIHDLILSG